MAAVTICSDFGYLTLLNLKYDKGGKFYIYIILYYVHFATTFFPLCWLSAVALPLSCGIFVMSYRCSVAMLRL